MLRAFLLLGLISAGVTGCAKDPVHALVDLRAKADPLSLYCHSGHQSTAASRTLAVVGCPQTSTVAAAR